MIALPAFVAYESSRFAPGDEGRFPGISLPPQLDRAVAKRKLEFLAGRSCAMLALARLVPPVYPPSIPIGDDRAPVWPRGTVGAITHTDGFAAAAVAQTAHAGGLGIDAERVVTPSAMEAVVAQVAKAEELAGLAGSGLADAVLLTVVFSAKESLYKCLFRRVGRYFDFQDARLVEVDASGTFTAELTAPLGGLARGSRLAGRFAVGDGLVHTAIVLSP